MALYTTVCCLPIQVLSRKLASKLTCCSCSNAHSALVDVRPLHIHRHPPCQHLHNPSLHTLRARLRILPSPRPRDLPNTHDRTLIRGPPHRRTHRLRRRAKTRPPVAKSQALWRRHARRTPPEAFNNNRHNFLVGQTESMATRERHLMVRLRLRFLSGRTRLHEQDAAPPRGRR